MTRPPAAAPADAAAEHRWRVQDVTLVGGAFIALNLVVPSVVVAVDVGGAAAAAARALIATLVVQLAVIGVIAVLIRGVYRLRFFDEIRWRRGYPARNGALCLWGMTLAIAVIAASALFPPNDTPIEQLLSTPGAVAMFAVYAVLFAPVLEETLFRGFLFRVVDQWAGPRAAVLTTAAAFGIVHAPQLWGSLAAILVIFAVGYALSEVRRRTGSLIPAVIVHTAYNGTILLVFLAGALAGAGRAGPDDGAAGTDSAAMGGANRSMMESR